MIEVVIIGAGASGMMAAISAAANNKNLKITILEHGMKPGRKILATGNGRCNLTNKKLNSDCFRSHNGERIDMWLKECNTDNIIDFFAELGMLCTDKNGYVYPYSCQAATVNDILVQACTYYGINIVTDAHVIDVTKDNNGFTINVSQGYTDDSGQRKKKREIYSADKVVLACGSKAYSSLGSDGSGYSIAKKLGLKIIPVVPALTGLKCREPFFKLAAGVRTLASIDLFVDHEKMASDRGELQLTEYGISGIPVFQVSRYGAYGLADGCKVHAVIDFMPEYTDEQLTEILNRNIDTHIEKTIFSILCGMGNNKLMKMLLSYCRIEENIKGSSLSQQQKSDIINAIKKMYTVITGTNDFEQSQVCAGGVRLSEVDDAFQSTTIPGLYIIGELLDVDGICGGYNLHWAWLTGMIAGRNLCK